MKGQPDNDMKVYIAVGTEGDIMENDAKNLASVLKMQQRKNLSVYFVSMPNENHLTILHNCVYKALETLNGKK